MKTQCPHCKAILKVEDKYAEKKAKCPKCNQLFVLLRTEKPTCNDETDTGQLKQVVMELKHEVEEISARLDIAVSECDKRNKFSKLEIKDLQERVQKLEPQKNIKGIF